LTAGTGTYVYTARISARLDIVGAHGDIMKHLREMQPARWKNGKYRISFQNVKNVNFSTFFFQKFWRMTTTSSDLAFNVPTGELLPPF